MARSTRGQRSGVRGRFGLVLLLAACSGAPDVPPAQPKTGRPALPAPTLSGPPPLEGVVVAELTTPSAETYFARNGKLGMLVERARGRWLAGPVRVGHAEPVGGGGMHDLAAAPADRTAAALSAHGDDFLLVWAVPVQAADELWGLELDAQGAALGEARKLATSFDRILWLELDPGAAVSCAAYETGRPAPGDGRPEPGDLHVVPWSPDKPAKATLLGRGPAGWHAIASGRGAAVAWVSELNDDRGVVR